MEVFAARAFMPVAERMMKENRLTKGYIGIRLGLLHKLGQYEMLAIKELDRKSDLLSYEPRLRGGFGTAA